MKKSIIIILLLLTTLQGYSQRNWVAKFGKEDWNVYEPKGKLVSLDTTKTLISTDILTIRMPEDMIGKTVAICNHILPMNIKGDSLEVRYRIKYDSVSMWTDVFRAIIFNYKTPDVQSFVYPKDRSVRVYRNADWQYEKIKLAIPADSKELYIILYSPDEGVVHLSEVHILIDGKPYHKITELKQGRDLDKEFDLSSKVEIAEINQQQIDNLNLLGHAWGYLKYYHPKAGGFDYNWDYELFRLIPKVLTAKDNKACEKIVSDFTRKLGKYETTTLENKDVVMAADYQWIENLQDKKLAQLFTDMQRAKRDFNSYVSFSENPLFTDFSNEDEYATIAFPDTGYRLLALFRYWNNINYFFPYKYLMTEKWEHALKEFISIFIAADTPLKYQLAVQRLSVLTNDSHAYSSHPAVNDFFGKYFASAIIKYIENKPVVIGFTNDTTSVLQKGDVILKAGDKTVDELKEFYKSYLVASNESVYLRDLAAVLLRSTDSLLSVTYERNGEVMTGEVKCNKTRSELSNAFAFMEKGNLYVKDSVLYVYPLKLDMNALVSSLKNRTSIKGIIVDLRCYPSESPEELMNVVFDKAVPFIKASQTSNGRPGEFSIVHEEMAGAENKDYFMGKVVVVVDERTQSFAEWMAMWFQAAPNAITIGSQSAGTDGMAPYMMLPGGIKTSFTTTGVYYPDGAVTQRVGLRLDEVVEPTIEGMRAGRDEVLERAFEIISE